MIVSAVSPFSPFDIAGVGLPRSRNAQLESQNQAAAASPERVVQGEVVSRQPIQNDNTSSTRDTLSNRRFNQDQSGFGFNARQAVNTYIGNQLQGERIDQQGGADESSLIDIFV